MTPISEEKAKQLFFETETARPGSIQAEMYMVDLEAYANVVAKYVQETIRQEQGRAKVTK